MGTRWQQRAEAFRRHNEDELELWLIYAGGVPKDVLEKIGQNPNKPTSAQVESNLAWVDALSDPQARESHNLLTFLVHTRMKIEQPIMYDLLQYTHMGSSPDFTAPDEWKLRARDCEGCAWLYDMLENSKGWILDRLDDLKVVLVVPDPYEASAFWEKSDKKQRSARAAYFKRLHEQDESITLRARDRAAREAAKKASGYSDRQLRRIIPPINARQKKKYAREHAEERRTTRD